MSQTDVKTGEPCRPGAAGPKVTRCDAVGCDLSFATDDRDYPPGWYHVGVQAPAGATGFRDYCPEHGGEMFGARKAVAIAAAKMPTIAHLNLDRILQSRPLIEAELWKAFAHHGYTPERLARVVADTNQLVERMAMAIVGGGDSIFLALAAYAVRVCEVSRPSCISSNGVECEYRHGGYCNQPDAFCVRARRGNEQPG